jgi:hypothetical protein
VYRVSFFLEQGGGDGAVNPAAQPHDNVVAAPLTILGSSV